MIRYTFVLLILLASQYLFSQGYSPQNKDRRSYDNIFESDVKVKFYEEGFEIPFDRTGEIPIDQSSPEKVLISAFTNEDSLFFKLVYGNEKQPSFKSLMNDKSALNSGSYHYDMDNWFLRFNYKLSFQFRFLQRQLIRVEIYHKLSGYCDTRLIAFTNYNGKWWISTARYSIDRIIPRIYRLRIYDANAIRHLLNNQTDGEEGFELLIDHMTINEPNQPRIILWNLIGIFKGYKYGDLFHPSCKW